MMRTKFFLMMLAAIVMGSQVTLFAQEKKGAKSVSYTHLTLPTT